MSLYHVLEVLGSNANWSIRWEIQTQVNFDKNVNAFIKKISKCWCEASWDCYGYTEDMNIKT